MTAKGYICHYHMLAAAKKTLQQIPIDLPLPATLCCFQAGMLARCSQLPPSSRTKESYLDEGIGSATP